MAKDWRDRNAFEAVGFAHVEAEHLRIGADLMFEVERLIEARGLTQAEAAKLRVPPREASCVAHVT